VPFVFGKGLASLHATRRMIHSRTPTKENAERIADPHMIENSSTMLNIGVTDSFFSFRLIFTNPVR
jgi:hypothetical protein